MSRARKILKSLAPELPEDDLYTLAVMIGSSPDDMPAEFFDQVVSVARSMGADRLREFVSR